MRGTGRKIIYGMLVDRGAADHLAISRIALNAGQTRSPMTACPRSRFSIAMVPVS
jgi:hypothetical protein